VNKLKLGLYVLGVSASLIIAWKFEGSFEICGSLAIVFGILLAKLSKSKN